MKTVKAKIKGTNAILEGCVCNNSFFVSVDHDIFERYSLDEVEICKDSLQVSETCKENAESFTSLEEAAEERARKIYPYEGGTKGLICETSIPIFKAGFIAGAEWMRKRDVEDMYMSDNRHFLKCYEQGKVDMKVEMMKDAVEGEIVKDISNKLAVTAKNVNLDGFKFGDKVKIIIVKK